MPELRELVCRWPDNKKRRVTRTLAFVRHADIEDRLRLGWVHVPGLEGTHHGQWSVTMEWLCQCPIPTKNGRS